MTLLTLLSHLTLLVGLLSSGFLVWWLFRRRGFAEERVIDLILSATVAAFLFSRALLIWQNYLSQGLIRNLRDFVLLLFIAPGELSFQLSLMVFFVVSLIFVRRIYNWKVFPAFDYLSLGLAMSLFFFRLAEVVRLGFSFALGIQLLYLANVFALLLIVHRSFYGPGRLFSLFMISTLKPLCALTGVTIWFIVEGSQVFLDFALGFQKGLSEAMSKDETRDYLLREQDEIAEELEQLNKTDPRHRPERVRENAPEEDSDEAYAGSRVAALQEVFQHQLDRVRLALGKLRRGSYGICDRCGKKIDPARLKALPDATYCLECATRVEEKP